MADSGFHMSIVVAVIGAIGTVGAGIGGAYFSPKVSELEDDKAKLTVDQAKMSDFITKAIEYHDLKSDNLETFNRSLSEVTEKAVDMINNAIFQVNGVAKCYTYAGPIDKIPEVKIAGENVLETARRFQAEVPKLAEISQKMRRIYREGDRIYLNSASILSDGSSEFDIDKLTSLQKQIESLSEVKELFVDFATKLDVLNEYGADCLSQFK